MSDTLWAPWRMDYITSPRSPECVFCAAAADIPAQNAHHLVLAATDDDFVILNRYPYAHGHIMVCPRQHVSGLGALSFAAQRSLFRSVVAAEALLRQALQPQGINIGMNIGKAAGAGIAAHIHVHLVPRWEGDTNFMPLLADCRVMPEHLRETWQTLLSHFAHFHEHLRDPAHAEAP
ncbi:MAG: HIT domain-containing protein [Proteobacteria bacterium]|nr:HIT domain-containing protein [Pseudomonadota bacterium]